MLGDKPLGTEYCTGGLHGFAIFGLGDYSPCEQNTKCTNSDWETKYFINGPSDLKLGCVG